MRESNEEWHVVPDVLREREPVRRGKPLKSDLSIRLLDGSTVFVEGSKTTFGSIYNLAKSHNKKARTKKTELNGKKGTLIWFEDTLPQNT